MFCICQPQQSLEVSHFLKDNERNDKKDPVGRIVQKCLVLRHLHS